jgi:hypothetical protein
VKLLVCNIKSVFRKKVLLIEKALFSYRWNFIPSKAAAQAQWFLEINKKKTQKE